MPRSHRTATTCEAETAAPAWFPPNLQPWGNAAAAAELQSREDAPTSFAGDLPEKNPADEDEVLFEFDKERIGKKAMQLVFKGLLPKSAGILSSAPLELGDDRNHQAELHEAEERAARELFDSQLGDDEAEAHEALRTSRLAEQNDWLAR